MTILVFILLAFGPVLADMYNRAPGLESLSRAFRWSAIYIASAMVFAGYLFLSSGPGYASLFLSGYLIEKAMSVDNLIVFGAVFAYFGVEAEYQHRVLHWGIVGSAVLRLAFISAGLAATFIFGRFMDGLFGAFVFATAYKVMGGGGDSVIDHDQRWYMRWARHLLPVSTVVDGRFFVRDGGRILRRFPAATPLLFCLIAIEITDIAFAFDSVPAVIGVTKDIVLAYSSVMFAVVGLRSMYFVLEALKRYTEALAFSVMLILYFIGGKMLVHALTNYEISAHITLVVIFACLSVGIILSIGRGALPAGWWAGDKK